MSDKTQVRNSVLDKLLGRKGAAEEIREQVASAEEELDAAGVQHKALTAPELEAVLATAIQAVRRDRVQKQAALTQDDLVDLILAVHDALADVPPEEARQTVMQMVADLMADDTSEIEMALFGEDEEVPEDGDEKAFTKVVASALPDFLKKLIDDQADMTDALIETAEIVEALEKADLPGRFTKMENSLARLLALAEAAPRRASVAAETRLPDAAALEKAVAALQADEYTTEAGILVRKAAGNGKS